MTSSIPAKLKLKAKLNRAAQHLVPTLLVLAVGACGEGAGSQHGLLGHWIGGGLFGEVDLCITSVDPVEAMVGIHHDDWSAHGKLEGSRMTLEGEVGQTESFRLDLVWDGQDSLSGSASLTHHGDTTQLGDVQFTRIGGC